jgi:hypothetical protein
VNVPAEVDEQVGLDVSAEVALGTSEYEWSDICAARGRLDVSAELARDRSEHERSNGSAERERLGGSTEGGVAGSEREADEGVRANVSAEGAFDQAGSGVSAEGAFEARSDVSAEGAFDQARSGVSAGGAFEARSDVSAEGAFDPECSDFSGETPSSLRAPVLSQPAATELVRRKVCGGEVHRVVIHLAPHLLSDGLVANLDDGTWIAPETWRRVACDCALDLVKVDEVGRVLDVGRRTRTIPPALARALDVRDAGRCRFPGCNHRRFLDRHHVKHWSNDGETKLDNLLTLCTAHHQLVHEGGWSVELDGDEARFFDPSGALLVRPRPPRVEDALADLEEAHASLDIGPATGLTLWNGKTPDYARCVEAALG